MKTNLFTAMAFATLIGASCGNEASSDQAINDEYDRVYMANCVFKTCDRNGDGVATAEEVSKVGSTLYKADGERALAEFGGDLDKENFLKIYQTPPNNIGGELIPNLVYKTVGDKKLMLDLYMPTKRSGEKIPMVMFVHGGGFWIGHKYIIRNDINPPTAKRLLDQGIAVASINYRLLDRKSVFIKDCLVDGKDAFAYLNQNSDKYGLDTENMFVWGESAGAHVALLLGLSDPADLPGDAALSEYRIKPRAVAAWFGVGFSKVWDKMEDNKRISLSEDLEVLQKESDEIMSLNYIDAQDPAILHMVGDKDSKSLYESSFVLRDALTEAGVENELIIVKNSGHSWAGENLDPNLEEISDITAKFIVDHIK